MVQILTPVVEQCDMQLCAVLEAQKALAKQIEFFSAGAHPQTCAVMVFSSLDLSPLIQSIVVLAAFDLGGVQRRRGVFVANRAFSLELLNSERVKEGEQPDAMLGSYAAKLAASRKKLKKVPDTLAIVASPVTYRLYVSTWVPPLRRQRAARQKSQTLFDSKSRMIGK